MFSVAKLCLATIRREISKNSGILTSMLGRNDQAPRSVWNNFIQRAKFSSCTFERHNRSSMIPTRKSSFLFRTELLPRFGVALLCTNTTACASSHYRQFFTLPAATYLKPSAVSTQSWSSSATFKTTVRQKSSSNDSKQYYSDKSKSSRQKLYYTLKHYIKTSENAEKFVSHLKEDEKKLLLEALNSSHGTDGDAAEEETAKITSRQLSLVFVHNCVPFIAFGFLDNAIMIIAGDFIDHSIGATLGISVMAAAALGNTVSDVCGIGLAGYVELLFYKLGLPVPALTPEQSEKTAAICASSGGKGIGIVIGCLIGMLPLLFISERDEEDDDEDDF